MTEGGQKPGDEFLISLLTQTYLQICHLRDENMDLGLEQRGQVWGNEPGHPGAAVWMWKFYLPGTSWLTSHFGSQWTFLGNAGNSFLLL